MPKVKHIEVTKAESGQKLINFLSRRLGGEAPRSLLMRLIRTGQVRVDGGRRKPFDRVDEGQAVRVPPVRITDENKTPPNARRLSLAHESADLLAVDKPAGLPTHPGSGHSDSVSSRLKAMFPDDPFAPTPAHRLDKDTSGLLLAARSYEKLTDLQLMLKNREVGKFYLCWIAAELAPGARLELFDELSKKAGPGGEIMRVGGGKPARANMRCLKTEKGASLIEVELLTGRTHQIRVQLSSRGMPIIGDPKYGKKNSAGMLLHCWKLVLPDLTLTLPPEWKGRFAVDQSLLS